MDSSYDSSDGTVNVDICATLLTQNAPKLPLREEIPSLGFEVVYNAAGVGDRASKHDAMRAAKQFRRNQELRDTKKWRIFPRSSKRVKKKLEERKVQELEIKQSRSALSYDSYNSELQDDNGGDTGSSSCASNSSVESTNLSHSSSLKQKESNNPKKAHKRGSRKARWNLLKMRRNASKSKKSDMPEKPMEKIEFPDFLTPIDLLQDSQDTENESGASTGEKSGRRGTEKNDDRVDDERWAAIPDQLQGFQNDPQFVVESEQQQQQQQQVAYNSGPTSDHPASDSSEGSSEVQSDEQERFRTDRPNQSKRAPPKPSKKESRNKHQSILRRRRRNKSESKSERKEKDFSSARPSKRDGQARTSREDEYNVPEKRVLTDDSRKPKGANKKVVFVNTPSTQLYLPEIPTQEDDSSYSSHVGYSFDGMYSDDDVSDMYFSEGEQFCKEVAHEEMCNESYAAANATLDYALEESFPTFLQSFESMDLGLDTPPASQLLQSSPAPIPRKTIDASNGEGAAQETTENSLFPSGQGDYEVPQGYRLDEEVKNAFVGIDALLGVGSEVLSATSEMIGSDALGVLSRTARASGQPCGGYGHDNTEQLPCGEYSHEKLDKLPCVVYANDRVPELPCGEHGPEKTDLIPCADAGHEDTEPTSRESDHEETREQGRGHALDDSHEKPGQWLHSEPEVKETHMGAIGKYVEEMTARLQPNGDASHQGTERLRFGEVGHDKVGNVPLEDHGSDKAGMLPGAKANHGTTGTLPSGEDGLPLLDGTKKVQVANRFNSANGDKEEDRAEHISRDSSPKDPEEMRQTAAENEQPINGASLPLKDEDVAISANADEGHPIDPSKPDWISNAVSAFGNIALDFYQNAAGLSDDTKVDFLSNTGSIEDLFGVLSNPGSSVEQIQLILTYNPDYIQVRRIDDGRLPLHVLCDRHLPDRSQVPVEEVTFILLQDIGILKGILLLIKGHFPEACQAQDGAGDLPLHILARTLMQWEATWYEVVYQRAAVDAKGKGKTAEVISNLYQLMSECIEVLLVPILEDKSLYTLPGSTGTILPLHIASIFTSSVRSMRLLLLGYPKAASIKCDLESLRSFVPNDVLPLELHDLLSTDFPKWEVESSSAAHADLKWSKARNIEGRHEDIEDNIRRSDLLFAFHPTSPYRYEKARIRRLEHRIQYEANSAIKDGRDRMSYASELVWIWMCSFEEEKSSSATYLNSVKRVIGSLQLGTLKFLTSVRDENGDDILDLACTECFKAIQRRLDTLTENIIPLPTTATKKTAPMSETTSKTSSSKTSSKMSSMSSSGTSSSTPSMTSTSVMKSWAETQEARLDLKRKGLVNHLCRLTFNVEENSFPTSFVILPYRLKLSGEGLLGIESPDDTALAMRFADLLLQLTDPRSILYYLDNKAEKHYGQSFYSGDGNPHRLAAYAAIRNCEDFLLSLYKDGAAYLYLINEDTGIPQIPLEWDKYPIVLNEPVNIVRKLLPLMLMGMLQLRGEKVFTVLTSVLLDSSIEVIPPKWIDAAKEAGAYHFSNRSREGSPFSSSAATDALVKFISSSSHKIRSTDRPKNGTSEWKVEISILKMLFDLNDTEKSFGGLQRVSDGSDLPIWTIVDKKKGIDPDEQREQYVDTSIHSSVDDERAKDANSDIPPNGEKETSFPCTEEEFGSPNGSLRDEKALDTGCIDNSEVLDEAVNEMLQHQEEITFEKEEQYGSNFVEQEAMTPQEEEGLAHEFASEGDVVHDVASEGDVARDVASEGDVAHDVDDGSHSASSSTFSLSADSGADAGPYEQHGAKSTSSPPPYPEISISALPVEVQKHSQDSSSVENLNIPHTPNEEIEMTLGQKKDEEIEMTLGQKKDEEIDMALGQKNDEEIQMTLGEKMDEENETKTEDEKIEMSLGRVRETSPRIVTSVFSDENSASSSAEESNESINSTDVEQLRRALPPLNSVGVFARNPISMEHPSSQYDDLFGSLAVQPIPHKKKAEYKDSPRVPDQGAQIWGDVYSQLERSGEFLDNIDILRVRVGIAEEAKHISQLNKKLQELTELQKNLLIPRTTDGATGEWYGQGYNTAAGTRKLLLRMGDLEDRILFDQIDLQHTTLRTFALAEDINWVDEDGIDDSEFEQTIAAISRTNSLASEQLPHPRTDAASSHRSRGTTNSLSVSSSDEMERTIQPPSAIYTSEMSMLKPESSSYAAGKSLGSSLATRSNINNSHQTSPLLPSFKDISPLRASVAGSTASRSGSSLRTGSSPLRSIGERRYRQPSVGSGQRYTVDDRSYDKASSQLVSEGDSSTQRFRSSDDGSSRQRYRHEPSLLDDGFPEQRLDEQSHERRPSSTSSSRSVSPHIPSAGDNAKLCIDPRNDIFRARSCTSSRSSSSASSLSGSHHHHHPQPQWPPHSRDETEQGARSLDEDMREGSVDDPIIIHDDDDNNDHNDDADSSVAVVIVDDRSEPPLVIVEDRASSFDSGSVSDLVERLRRPPTKGPYYTTTNNKYGGSSSSSWSSRRRPRRTPSWGTDTSRPKVIAVPETAVYGGVHTNDSQWIVYGNQEVVDLSDYEEGERIEI